METNVIVVDRIANVAFVNGMLRVESIAMNAAGQEKPSGTLLIPGNVVGRVIQSLVNAVQELEKKAREAAAASGAISDLVPTGKLS